MEYPTGASGRAGRSSQERELTFCPGSIAGLPVVIRANLRIGAKIAGSDTLDVYEAEGAFPLARGDTLRVVGTADDPAGQALVLAIIRSVRLRTEASK